MNRLTLLIASLFFLAHSPISMAQQAGHYEAIYSGTPWFDNQGHVVSAHGANIVHDGGTYYLFGEYKTDSANVFHGFACYSSTDLCNWKFERMALPVQPSGKLGPNRIGERPKVMKCPTTGEYVMYMHVDTLGYQDQFIGYATAKQITGPYTFHGPLLFNGNPIRKWDMGSFQDADGSGYILIHGGMMYKLGDDYKSITEQVIDNHWSGSESPAVFKKGGLYYWLVSDLTSWERNDNVYYTATSLKGPWTKRGFFAPEGTLTWNSQTTFVLPVAGIKDTAYLFMGDRWSFPKQASAATYVWQPLRILGTSLSIPTYGDAWSIHMSTGEVVAASLPNKIIRSSDKKAIQYRGSWQQDTLSVQSSDTRGASFSVHFRGTQVGFVGLARPDGGYARVNLQNSKGEELLTTIVDMYCKYPVSRLKFLSPILAKDNYVLTISVMGGRGNWSDKRKNLYGSTGNWVSLDQVLIQH